MPPRNFFVVRFITYYIIIRHSISLTIIAGRKFFVLKIRTIRYNVNEQISHLARDTIHEIQFTKW